MIKYMEEVNTLVAEMTGVIEQMLKAHNCEVTDEISDGIFDRLMETVEPFCIGDYKHYN